MLVMAILAAGIGPSASLQPEGTTTAKFNSAVLMWSSCAQILVPRWYCQYAYSRSHMLVR